MKAVVFDRFGEPADVLAVRDVPEPRPRPGQVRVRMLASPVNPSDLMTVRGIYGRLPDLPASPGFEGVGVVEASGGGLLGRFLTGRRVAVLGGRGGNWAEKAVIPARQAVPLAGDISDEQAAMFFVNPATACVITREVLRVPAGEWLLQTAAGSALGRMIIRLGGHYGFRTINVVRREEQAEELRTTRARRGSPDPAETADRRSVPAAEEFVVFDPARHEADALVEQVHRITGGRGARFAVDPVGGPTGSAVVRCLAVGGRMLCYGTLSSGPLSFSPRDLMTPGASVEGFWLARWMEKLGLLGKLKLVRRITKLMRTGVLTSEVAGSFPLERIAEAVAAAEQPARGGKVLLQMNEGAE